MARASRGGTEVNKEMRLPDETLKSLGRTLYHHRREHLGLIQAKLQEEASKEKEEFKSLSHRIKSGFIGGIERGELRLKLADLYDLSRLYEIDILNLIYSLPREADIAFQTLMDDAFMPVPLEIEAAEGACYWVPRVRPRDSSLIVMKLQLQPEGHTSKDHGYHEEDEVVEVISGEAVVRFPELGHEASLSKGDRIHFRKEKHVVHNPSSENEAWMFIYRELPRINVAEE